MSSIYPESGAGGGPSSLSERDPAGGPIAEAREKLGEGAAAVRSEAAHFAERTRDEVAGQIEAKTEAVTDALGVFADAIRRASDELSGQDQTYAAKLATQAADGLQSFTRNLSGKSPEDMLHAARDLGRNNPTAFFAGAVLAGVAIGRFARSSAEHGAKSRSGSEPDPGLDADGSLSNADVGSTLPGAAFGREV